eukprot:g3731.t1
MKSSNFRVLQSIGIRDGLIIISPHFIAYLVRVTSPDNTLLNDGLFCWSLIYSLALFSALLTSFKYPANVVGLCLVASTMIFPHIFLSETNQSWRAILTFASAFYTTRTSQLVFENDQRFDRPPTGPTKPFFRIAHVGMTFFDIQTRSASLKTSEWRRFLLTTVYQIFFDLVCLYVISLFIIPTYSIATWVTTSLIGLYGYYSLDLFGHTIQILWALFANFHFPPLMSNPELSLSLRDFWKRWNHVIQELLGKYVYRPSRKQLGLPRYAAVFLTFLTSGLIHTVPAFVAGLHWTHSCLALLYFIAQYLGIIVEVSFLEKYLDYQNKCPTFCKRIWVYTAVLVPLWFCLGPILATHDTFSM